MNLFVLSFTIFISVSCNNPEETFAKEFRGKVVKIIDGDTFDLLVDKTVIRIRLNAIDCPERGQDFYRKSKDILAKYCFGQLVRVISHGTDRNRRIIGDVYLESGEYVNAAMIKDGYAWHFKKYSRDKYLDSLECDARSSKRGLWAQTGPIAPWDWRAMKKVRRDSIQQK
jgi:micrococcal nuclease